jgi:GT2 family glycosyltransferase/SAM-dependent methyltransferase
MLQFTGERFVPGVKGDIEIEHVHRYHAVAELVAGLRVLDIACGEGYGSRILANHAAQVVGVDISDEAISHARVEYVGAGVRFEVGSCLNIPVPDASVDVVVSFETLEHVAEHDKVLQEYSRVLAPGGWICVSCPDKLEYSDLPGTSNPYHVRELYREEFRELLQRHFRRVDLYGQSVKYGSMLGPVGSSDARLFSYRATATEPARSPGILRPTYLLAVASDADCPALGSGLFEPQVAPFVSDLQTLNQRLTEAQIRNERLTREQQESGRERERLRAVVASMVASRSWRVTGPLRWLSGMLRRVKSSARLRTRLASFLQAGYRLLPVPVAMKRAVKDWVFLRLPRSFESTATYRRWRAFHAERTALLRIGQGSTKPPAASSPMLPDTADPNAVQGLRRADGRWEWADYDEVVARVRRTLEKDRAAWQPVRPEILDFDESGIEAALKNLRFPVCSAPLVSVVIPVYDKLKFTVECLVALADSAPSVDYEVIVADDASRDDTALALAAVPNLTVLSSGRNSGFLRNVNRTLAQARGRFILLLNNDVQVQSGCVDQLVATAVARSGVGAVGPKLVYPSGHLQEAGCSFEADCSTEMVGLNQSPDLPRFNYLREVDYCSGACLLVDAAAFRSLGGFDDIFAPAYCEDSDLCLRLRQQGLNILYQPAAVAVHHLSVTMAQGDQGAKRQLIGRNLEKFSKRWQATIDRLTDVRAIAFYLPQFHPIPENDLWWGKGFTEWRNVARARPNFSGHYQPRVPGELGHYDLRVASVMEEQAALARRYGIAGFCYYYYWFAGKRLLEMPLGRMLETGRPDFPFCICWANENWTRRWDGQDDEILVAQAHSDQDDADVIRDLIRYMRRDNYIRVRGRPLLLVYRVTQFPDFARTASVWRDICRREGVGEIYLALVESFDLVHSATDPATFGCDASVEFPPHGLANPVAPPGPVLNAAFDGKVCDYRDLAVAYCLREDPPYIRFRSVVPGWDNTARRQDHSFCFDRATPGAFQAWAEIVLEQTRALRSGDERIVFVNAWNEWAEGAYLEPDARFGHTFLEALRNARDAAFLKRPSSGAVLA